jgi:hypothetical protein
LDYANPAHCNNPAVFSAVWLPDGGQPSDHTRYRFYYNPYGEMARVELPTGVAVEYDPTPGSGVVSQQGVPTYANYIIYRRTMTRRVYSDGMTLEGLMVNTVSNDATTSTVVVDHLKPDGTLLAREKHYFYSNYQASLLGGGVSYPVWSEGFEYQTESLSADGATVLRRQTLTMQQRAPVSWWTGPFRTPENAPPNDPRIVEMVATLVDANLVSKQTFGYDQYNNRTDVYGYGFSAGAPGPLIRRTHTGYVTSNNGIDYAGDLNIHIRSLPLKTQVFDAGGK